MLDLRERPTREKPARDVSASQQFERVLRADTRLNAMARLAWLMCALSHKYGSAYMAVPKMAVALGVSVNMVRNGLKKLVALGLFEREPSGERRGPNKYRRARPPPDAVPGEMNDKARFVRWVRRQRRLDLATRAAWLLADLCAHDGYAEISNDDMSAQLNVDEANARVAVRRLLELKIFAREKGGGRGHRNRYRSARYIADIADAAVSVDEIADEDPTMATPIIDEPNYFEELLKWQKQQRN